MLARVPKASATVAPTTIGAKAATVRRGSIHHMTTTATTAKMPRPMRSQTASMEPLVMAGGSSRKRLMASPGEARVGIVGQLVSAADLGDLARVEDEDRIGPLDGGEPVGDHDAGAPLEQAVHGLVEELLGVPVESRRSLVENDQTRILEEHS